MLLKVEAVEQEKKASHTPFVLKAILAAEWTICLTY